MPRLPSLARWEEWFLPYLMNNLITDLQALLPIAWVSVFFTAMAFALFMAVIPHRYDPTGFITDKETAIHFAMDLTGAEYFVEDVKE